MPLRRRRSLHRPAAAVPSRHRPPPPALLKLLASDPLFQVLTGDGSHWLDPFCGQALPVRGDITATACAHWADSGDWINRQPMPLIRLIELRWRHDLLRLLPHEPRLRLFSPGGDWVNPFTGELAADIVREDGRIGTSTVEAMARVLAGCPAAAAGRMQESAVLMTKVRTGGAGPPLGSDLMQAQKVQQRLMCDLPRLPGFELAAHSAGHSGVSGDLFLALQRPNGRLLLALGDVSGHGLQAALVSASALKALRLFAREEAGPLELLARCNQDIGPDLIPGQFLTLFLAELDPATRCLTCASAGHHAAVMANLGSGDTVLRRFGPRGPAIGFLPDAAFRRSLREERAELDEDSIFLLWTDGATEAADASDEEFGEIRLFGSLLAHAHLPLTDLVDALAQDVRRFAGKPLADDLTLLALEVDPAHQEA